MERWDYLVAEFENGQCRNLKSNVEGIYPNYPRGLRAVDAMGYLGRDHWELVTVLREMGSETMYFKRVKA